jgi:serine/threonine protein kinase
MPNILPEPLNSQVQAAGWIPLESKGEGGGGKVYLCVKAALVRSIENLPIGGGAVRDPQKAFDISSRVIRDLHSSFITERDALAALKIPKALDDPSTLDRLKRETSAMKSISDPSLIRLIDNDKSNSPSWFVMEYHRCGTLVDAATRYQGKIVKVLESIRPMVEATGLLHEHGYIHRDIKPNNIFLSEEGRLILGDFGIVFPREEGHITDTGMTLFSRDWIPDWMRFTDLEPEPKVDVFMLAKVIYYMVTGGGKVLPSQLDEDRFDLRHRLKGVEGSADLQELLAGSITVKDRNCKFETASSFLVRIDELLKQLTGSVQGSLLFSFLSVNSATDVPVRRGYEESPRYSSLTRLQVFLPEYV